MHYHGNCRCALRKRKQQGFSLVAAFIVIAILMAVVAYFVAGQGLNTSQTGTYNNSARASSIISQGGYLQGGVNLLLSSGTTSIGAMTFDTSPTTGLFNPTSGGVQLQVPDLTSFASTASPDGIWTYRGNRIWVGGVGSGVAGYGVVLSGLKQSICQQINAQLHGMSPSAAVPSSGLAVAAFRASAPIDLATAVTDMHSVLAITGWDKGCVQTTDATTNYVYYQILVPQ